VIVDLIADYVAGTISAGDDAREVRWIGSDEIRRLAVSPQTIELLQRQYGFGRAPADGSPVPNMS
jgi:hypothetical protein